MGNEVSEGDDQKTKEEMPNSSELCHGNEVKETQSVAVCSNVLFLVTTDMKRQCSKIGPSLRCVSIELQMYLASGESTREARGTLGFISCHSNASLVLSQPPACIDNLKGTHIALTIS